VGVRGSGQEARSRISDDDTALSPAATDMRSVLAAGSMQRVVFGSDWPFSALTLTGSGDPQPDSIRASPRPSDSRSSAPTPCANCPAWRRPSEA